MSISFKPCYMMSTFSIYHFKNILAFLLLCCTSIYTKAQTNTILTQEDFINQVKKYHPTAKQAAIGVQRANASLLAARGYFDPTYEFSVDDKKSDNINYYRYSSQEIKIPTITGVTIKSGIENTTGIYTNPEFSNGKSSYVGIEIPLLKGLLIDKQRAVLQQAKIYKKLSTFEQANTINDLLYEANLAFVRWTVAYQINDIYSKYAALAKKRMDLVKIAFVNGDRSAADTIEAFTQLQSLQLLSTDAKINLITSCYELSVYLWDDSEKPYLLADSYIPDTTLLRTKRDLTNIIMLEEKLTTGHPLLAVYISKNNILEVEKRLKYQNLLPTFNAKANLLTKENFEKLSLSSVYMNNNYKFGVSFKMPLLMRQAKGEYKEVKYKLTENNLLLIQKRAELLYKLKRYYNETLLNQEQINNAIQLKASYSALLKVEELKFSQGESSLFLINARENKLIEIDQKLMELQFKYLKSFYSTLWSAGILN